MALTSDMAGEDKVYDAAINGRHQRNETIDLFYLAESLPSSAVPRGTPCDCYNSGGPFIIAAIAEPEGELAH
jgi:hypothetical protein